jgi:phosphatidylglycerophosphate synthase
MRENFFEGLYSLISGKISPFFIRTSLTPNQVTVISGVFGVVGAYMLVIDEHLYLFIASVFIQVYTILDLVDGDIAREKEMQSYFGMWMDIFFDKLIDFLIIIFLSIGVFINTDNPLFLIYGIALMGFIFSIQFIMVLNDTYFKKCRGNSGDFLSIRSRANKKTNMLAFSALVFFRKHLSMQHTTFTFIISIIAATNTLEWGLVFLTIYSLVSLVILVVSNFYQIK